MRALIITLAIMLMAGFATAQMPTLKGPAIPKVDVKIPEIPKAITEDTFLEASLSQEGGKPMLTVTVILPAAHPAHTLKITAREGDAADGPWESLTIPPYSADNTVTGKNTFTFELKQAPTKDYLKLSMGLLEGNYLQDAHAAKVYELYCVGKQIKN